MQVSKVNVLEVVDIVMSIHMHLVISSILTSF